MKLSTIGYEGASLGDFLATLELHDIKRVIDIRELPQSRRPGFSKSALSEALMAVGIAYEHVKSLGDPKPGRDAARAGNYTLFETIFRQHLGGDLAQLALRHVAEVAQDEHCVLLCFEREPKHCHRRLVGQEVARLYPFAINHVGVRPVARFKRGNDAAADRYAGAF